ncbi:hypothetical protein LTR66_000805 [Elasticomyces elasticus]|nr:hypothetical protein LTR66_000805 [Elasticomyces elasticus]
MSYACALAWTYTLAVSPTNPTQLCAANVPSASYAYINASVIRCCDRDNAAVSVQDECTEYCAYSGTPDQWAACLKDGLDTSQADNVYGYCQAAAASSVAPGRSASESPATASDTTAIDSATNVAVMTTATGVGGQTASGSATRSMWFICFVLIDTMVLPEQQMILKLMK